MQIDHVGGLETLDLSQTTGVQLEVFANPDLTRLEYGGHDPQFIASANFLVSINPSLEELILGGEGGGGLVVDVNENAALETVSLPDLAAATQLHVASNTSLSSLSAPSIEALDMLVVTGNPVLPDCQAWALVDAIEAAGNSVEDTVDISNNLADSCTP